MVRKSQDYRNSRSDFNQNSGNESAFISAAHKYTRISKVNIFHTVRAIGIKKFQSIFAVFSRWLKLFNPHRLNVVEKCLLLGGSRLLVHTFKALWQLLQC